MKNTHNFSPSELPRMICVLTLTHVQLTVMITFILTDKFKYFDPFHSDEFPKYIDKTSMGWFILFLKGLGSTFIIFMYLSPLRLFLS